MQVFSDDGARIEVAVDGNGDDVIVLLAGFALSKSMWDEQTAALSATHRIVRPELRGMGKSSAPNGPYLMETLAADVANVLDACGIERATIAGHSLGGYVSLAFARMFTERVERLALVCSRIDADSPEAAQRRYDLVARTESSGSIEPVVDAFLPQLLAPESATQNPALVERLREMLSQTQPPGAAEMLRGMAERVSSEDIAGDLAMPVLVIGGSLDALIPAEKTREAAAAFPNGQLVICEGSGHMPMFEKPGCVTAALQELLGRPALR
ncbi:MAG TPA: alpha/beta hydrolase [Candidatus Tumulicola sp.]|jgi:pimeloyl-ACP methyl ester carboxylesterase